MKNLGIFSRIVACLIVMICCSKTQAVIPEVATNCLSGECIENQFSGKFWGDKTYFYAVVIDRVELKVSPSIQSTTIAKLHPTDTVIVLYKEEPAAEKDGEKVTWVFVKMYYTCKLNKESLCKGWLLDKNLAYKNMFVEDKTWKTKKLEYSYGDINYYISFIDNSHYTGKWVSTYPADKNKSGTVSGILLRYKNVIYLNDSNMNGHRLFINLCDSKKDESCMLKLIE